MMETHTTDSPHLSATLQATARPIPPRANLATHTARRYQTALTRITEFCALCAVAAAVLSAGSAQAEYLQTIPGPDATGGMLMPMVSLDFDAQRVSIHMSQSDTVTMYPLQAYRVGGALPFADAMFDPALAGEPWYGLLDPTRDHLPFSTQFGFMLMSANAHLLPAGTYVYLKATQISDGLKIYDTGYRSDLWEQDGGGTDWFQIFGVGNFGGTLAPQLDNVAAWGDAESIQMWHPIVLADAPGIYSARFEIYLGDAYAVPLQGWSTASIGLNWVAAVPEPSATAALIAALLGAGILTRRRKAAATASGRGRSAGIGRASGGAPLWLPKHEDAHSPCHHPRRLTARNP